ncbi:hypothetical protein GGS26DRAFT_409486 [Hypomontagnella submonticulosa]|nr:hypothetical protein GGS26DRAFT_409486 [Hypomontagnella submonticulosa]
MKIGIITSAILFAARSVVCAAGCLEVAQTEIPSCGQSCFVENAPSVGCDGTDFVCQCQKEAALYAVIEPCVASGCPEPSFQAVIDGASSVCNCATAIPGILAVGSSLGSITAAPAMAGTVLASVYGTATSNPTATSTTSKPATPSSSQGVVSDHRNDMVLGLAAGVAVAIMISMTLM